MADPPWPMRPCRSCRQPVIWTTTERGKPMPVDGRPAAGGNLAVFRAPDGSVRSRVVGADLAFGRTDLHLSHFVACPHAERWRTSRRTR